MLEAGHDKAMLRVFRDRGVLIAVWSAAAMVAGAFIWLLADIAMQGAPRFDLFFLIDAPANSGRSGGIGPILVSTALILAVAITATVPVGLGTAIFLSEFNRIGGLPGRMVGVSLDVLAGVPSIVFGLFGNAFFCIWLGLGFSILSGGLTLACMVLPIFIRVAEAGLRMTPDEWRNGAAALGLSRLAVLRQILLPAAAPSLVLALMLGIGRSASETAALIFTSGYVDRMPASLLDSGRAISVHIYDLSMNVAGGDPGAYASALALIVFLFLINGAAKWITDSLIRRRIVTI